MERNSGSRTMEHARENKKHIHRRTQNEQKQWNKTTQQNHGKHRERRTEPKQTETNNGNKQRNKYNGTHTETVGPFEESGNLEFTLECDGSNGQNEVATFILKAGRNPGFTEEIGN